MNGCFITSVKRNQSIRCFYEWFDFCSTQLALNVSNSIRLVPNGSLCVIVNFNIVLVTVEYYLVGPNSQVVTLLLFWCLVSLGSCVALKLYCIHPRHTSSPRCTLETFPSQPQLAPPHPPPPPFFPLFLFLFAAVDAKAVALAHMQCATHVLSAVALVCRVFFL